MEIMIPTNESTVSQLLRPMREQDRTWLGGGGAGRGGHRARLAAVLRAGGTCRGLQGGGGTRLASLGLLLVLGPPVLEPDLHLKIFYTLKIFRVVKIFEILKILSVVKIFET